MFDKLKWLWDPRSDVKKAFDKWDEETPLKTHTLTISVTFLDKREPHTVSFDVSDFETGLDKYRYNSENIFAIWTANVVSKGLRIGSTVVMPHLLQEITLIGVSETEKTK